MGRPAAVPKGAVAGSWCRSACADSPQLVEAGRLDGFVPGRWRSRWGAAALPLLASLAWPRSRPRIRARTRCALVLPSWCACLLPGGSPHRVSSPHGLDVAQPGHGTRAERACAGFRGIKPFASLTFYSTIPRIHVPAVPQSASTATN